jgi:hypothetical protein
MLATYKRLWPECPFTFRIPYQVDLQFRPGLAPIEPVPSPVPIKACLLRLIEDLPDDEWVYWCIDDKFLIELNVQVAAHLHQFVTRQQDPTVSGVLFCRCRAMCRAPSVSQKPVFLTDLGVQLLQRYDFNQIWLHQYLRAGVLRKLFEDFPDRDFLAIEMDDFTAQGHNAQKLPGNQIFYVTQQNFMVLGESTRRGQLTRTCLESLRNHGLPVPGNFSILDEEVRMGGCKHLPTKNSISHEFM